MISNREILIRDRGKAYNKIDKYDLAREDFDRAIDLYSKEKELDNTLLADLYVSCGVSYSWLDNFDQAKADYKKALRIDPGNKNARIYLDAV